MRRALVIGLLLASVAACDESDPVARAGLAVTFDEVFVDRSDPRPAGGADDDEDLVDVAGERLGADSRGREGCKLLPIYWLPTSPAETASTTARTATVCARMPRVKVGDWRDASGSFAVFEADGGFRVRVEAEGLVPHSVYSAWLVYLDDGDAYALAPIGGPPNLLLPDDDGSASLERIVPERLLREDSLLANSVPLDGDAEQRLRRGTEIQVVLYYHSDAQSNGNATPGAPAPARGRVGVPGRIGLGAHAHLVGTLAPLP